MTFICLDDNISKRNEANVGEIEDPIGIDKNTLRKIHFLLEKTILSSVKCLNEATVYQYLNIVKNSFPIDTEDWAVLEEKIRHAVGKGPKLHVKCLRGSLSSVKKTDSLTIRAFISLPSNSSDPITKIIEGPIEPGNPTDESDIKFDLDGCLPLPELEN